MLKKLATVIALTIFVSAPVYAVGYYAGAKAGWVDPDVKGLDAAFNIGGLFGVEVKNADLSYGAELEITGTASDGDASVGTFDGKWDVTTYALYGVLKYGATAYGKLKLGILAEDVSVDIAGFNDDGSDEGLSGGVGVGYHLNEQVSVEAEATMMEEDLIFYSLGINYSFY